MIEEFEEFIFNCVQVIMASGLITPENVMFITAISIASIALFLWCCCMSPNYRMQINDHYRQCSRCEGHHLTEERETPKASTKKNKQALNVGKQQLGMTPGKSGKQQTNRSPHNAGKSGKQHMNTSPPSAGKSGKQQMNTSPSSAGKSGKQQMNAPTPSGGSKSKKK